MRACEFTWIDVFLMC